MKDKHTTTKDLAYLIAQVKQGSQISQISAPHELQFVIDYISQTGCSLLKVLEDIRIVFNANESNRLAKEKAFAGPEMTIKILRILPIVGIVLGYILGVNPIVILLFDNSGRFMLGIGLMFYGAGFITTSKMLAKFNVHFHENLQTDSAILLTLIRSAIFSGQNLIGAIRALSVVDPSYALIANELKRGTPFKFSGVPAYLDFLDSVYRNGLSPIPIIENRIWEIHSTELYDSTKAGEKLAISLVVPLGACFLPAFICIGVLPIISSMFASI